MKIINKFLFVFLIPLVFFCISLYTLENYGISWDEPLHFARGQAYFRLLTTGKKDYSDLSGIRSYYQNDSLNANYFLQNDSAHPPTNDIFAAFFNFVFYQRLGWLGDIESLHLFNVVSSSLLIIVVCLFAYEEIGSFAALVSGLTISTYPLFFSESHFNIKDPAETAFFALAIYLFWKSLKKFDWKYLIGFGISVGLALGIKFNIFFLPFILIPYLFIRYLKKIPKIPKIYLLGLFLSLFIALLFFYIFWPYLWGDPITNFIEALKYYKNIGTGQISHQSNFFIGGFNLYPIYWILITTPPLVIVLTLVGIANVFSKKYYKEHTSLLWLLWFIVPIFRVSIPKTSIYGGIRQIMEFLPAMALLSGLGAEWIYTRVDKKIKYLLIIFFVFPIITLIKLHPNENVYFNFIIGGLKGAQENNVPYWGNSFGNAYLQAVKWINKNAESNAKLALVQGTMTNISKTWLRKDISFSNGYWSGIDRKGEYLVELTHDDPVKVYPYVWGYIEKFLKPIYEVKIDDVAIARVWKNDFENTYPELQKKEIPISLNNYEVIKDNKQIIVYLKNAIEVTRVVNTYIFSNCIKPRGYVEVSEDKHEWKRLSEEFPSIQMENAYTSNSFSYFLLGEKISAIKFVFDNINSCGANNFKIGVYALE